ncbi:MAG TPA: phosphatidate cytidylyltransferase [Flavobacteriales bacterium]|nr:phosphatidate cytidylyltransferase [Flavobacteriales bacterium]
MNNFFTRALFGAVYVGLILGSLSLGAVSFGFLCMLILILALDEYFKLVKRLKISPPDILIIVCAGLSFILVFMNKSIDLNVKYLFIIPLCFLLFMIKELVKNTKNPLSNVAFGVFGMVYIFSPMTSLFYMGFYDNYSWVDTFQPELLFCFFVLIWANDTGAYLAGSLFGKRKLFERISPKKTVEGSVGGIVLALVVAYGASLYAQQISFLDWLVIALIVVVFGSLGDLFESLLKRKVDVKDSGSLIPGHGGILDRFDSILFAAPVVFTYLALIAN